MLGVGGYLTLNECYGEGKGQKKATEGQDPPAGLFFCQQTHTHHQRQRDHLATYIVANKAAPGSQPEKERQGSLLQALCVPVCLCQRPVSAIGTMLKRARRGQGGDRADRAWRVQGRWPATRSRPAGGNRGQPLVLGPANKKAGREEGGSIAAVAFAVRSIDPLAAWQKSVDRRRLNGQRSIDGSAIRSAIRSAPRAGPPTISARARRSPAVPPEPHHWHTLCTRQKTDSTVHAHTSSGA